MNFTLQQIRHANMICFPEDFERLLEKHSTLKGWTFSDKTLLGFIVEFGSTVEMLEVAEKMIQDLLNGE